jgi:predicted DNA-binding transcriptional regulator YafY
VPARHEKLAQALDLILTLAASHQGRTVSEIAEELSCSRRTVERLLAAIGQAVGDALEARLDGERKRWRMRGHRVATMVPLTPTELHEVASAARRLQEDGLPERAALLRAAAHKMQALADERTRRRAEPDLEALLQGEGFAARPGPRVSVPDGVIETLRHALLAQRVVRVRYLGNSGGAAREHLLEPCGLLYGLKPYLLAAKRGKPDAAVWRLDRIAAAELTEDAFVPREGFDLATLTRDCFGVWREAPQDVVLRFDARAAADAAGWRFHPSQSSETAPDGCLLVRFRAGGIEEMANHLATWGDTVEVLSPPALRERLARMGEALVRRHAAT